MAFVKPKQLPHAVAALCLGGLLACTGRLGAAHSDAAPEPGPGPFPLAAGAGADPSTFDPTAPRSGPNAGQPSGTDGTSDNTAAVVGATGLHRLNNREYANTIEDLLGVPADVARGFIDDEQAAGFDNIAAALGVTEARYEQYFHAADSLIEAAFASPATRARALTCDPDQQVDAASSMRCLEDSIETFGRRAYRRPLTPTQSTRLFALGQSVLDRGEGLSAAAKQVGKALLSSAPFLYRLELDPSGPAELDSYELASRLSYLLWSTMPDARLLELADSGALLQPSALQSELERMLADPRAQRFVEGFGGQWLGMRALHGHQVDPSAYPSFGPELRAAMVAEGLSYFDRFVHGGDTLDAFFTRDVHYVDSALARLYGLPAAAADPETPVTNASDGRRGFLGLASYLTLTSFSYRTAPTLRGKWVLENLLCSPVAPPPANVPLLDNAGDDPAELQSQNVRVRLQAHRTNPKCAGCHTLLDPIGFGLERFDAIGAERSHYDNGDAIDASGLLPDGTAFDGLLELSDLLADDARFVDCARDKLVTYALGRALTRSDQPYLDAIGQRWRARGLGVPQLLSLLIESDLFRLRGLEPAP